MRSGAESIFLKTIYIAITEKIYYNYLNQTGGKKCSVINIKKLPLLLALCVFIGAVLPSCSKSGGELYPLTVNGIKIDGELFCYYMSVARSEGAAAAAECVDKATEKCVQYIAAEQAFNEAGLSITKSEEAENAADVNALWNLFGEYYSSIGVSRSTCVRAKLSERRIEKLRQYYFGEGGSDEISEEELRGCLGSYFAAFKGIELPLTGTDSSGSETELSEEEKQSVIKTAETAAKEINNGKALDTVLLELAGSAAAVTAALETRVIKEQSSYGQAFYASLTEIEEGSAGIIQTEDSVWLCYRVKILSDSTIYEKYKDECLQILSDTPLISKINELANSYTGIRNSDAVAKCKKIMGY